MSRKYIIINWPINMKKWFTLTETIISIFIVGIIWVLLTMWISEFIWAINTSKKMEDMTSVYDNLIKELYYNNFNWWILSGSFSTGLVMRNKWLKDPLLSWYIAYNCNEQNFNITQVFSGATFITNKYSKTFSWINCNNLSGWTITWGYRIGFDLSLLNKNQNIKYLFNEE